jgi:hypothetical protein
MSRVANLRLSWSVFKGFKILRFRVLMKARIEKNILKMEALDSSETLVTSY